MSIKISCIGCTLIDQIFNSIDFNSTEFKDLCSHNPGDGGLEPGKLVFSEHLEKFSGLALSQIINKLTQGRNPDAVNVGGPGIVAAIHASQLLEANQDITIEFYGSKGTDAAGTMLETIVKKTPINTDTLTTMEGDTPTTVVLSDPLYHEGHGERTFINNLGTAATYNLEQVPETALKADIVFLGGTALVPKIHEAISPILKKAKMSGSFTIAATVYDFRNQQRAPLEPWPLVAESSDYSLLDLLIMDKEEALRISGADSLKEALHYFKNMGVGATVITHGAQAVHFFAQSSWYTPAQISVLPVCEAIDLELQAHPEKRGDTTGCGDNFAGGILASIAEQMSRNPQAPLHILEAISWGVVSGGFSCLYFGGTFVEETPLQKRELLLPYFINYQQQISDINSDGNRELQK